MRKLISQPTPAFVQAIKNGLSHWSSKTINLDADSIKELDPVKKNIFLIVDYGMQLPDLWQPTAELMVQVFPLPDRNGYWNLWLEKLTAVIANAPKPTTPTLVRLQINYGKLLRSLWRLEEAKKAHHIALQDAQKIKGDVLLAHVLMEMGWDYLWENDLGKAQSVGEKALQIYEAVENIPIVQLVDTLRVLGTVEIRRGNVDQAIKLLNRALRGAREIRIPIVLARTYMSLGIAYRRKSDILEAMDCFEKASEVLLKTTYEGDKVSVFLNIGSLYFDQEEWDAAEIAFKRVNNRYLRESGDIDRQAALWNNLGNVYCEQGKLEEAEKFLQDALALWPRTSDEIEWANTLATLARVHIFQNRATEAEQLIKEAKKKVRRYPAHKRANEISDELKELQKLIETKKTD